MKAFTGKKNKKGRGGEIFSPQSFSGLQNLKDLIYFN